MCAFSASGFKELHLTTEATSITHGSGPFNVGEEDSPQRHSAMLQKTWVFATPLWEPQILHTKFQLLARSSAEANWSDQQGIGVHHFVLHMYSDTANEDNSFRKNIR